MVTGRHVAIVGGCGRSFRLYDAALVRWLPRYPRLWVRALLHGIAGPPRGPAAVERPR